MIDRIPSRLTLIAIVAVLLIGPLVTLSLFMGGPMLALAATAAVMLCFCAFYIFLVRHHS